MPTLGDVTSHQKESPHTYAGDLIAVSTFIEELSPHLIEVNNDVYIHQAVLELTNASGYPVGNLIWDGQDENFIFVAAGASFDEVS